MTNTRSGDLLTDAAEHALRHPVPARPAVTLAEALHDPNAVHVNILRGAIAKPTIAQIMHIYPEVAALVEAAEDAYFTNPCGPCAEGTKTRDCALRAALAQIKGER